MTIGIAVNPHHMNFHVRNHEDPLLAISINMGNRTENPLPSTLPQQSIQTPPNPLPSYEPPVLPGRGDITIALMPEQTLPSARSMPPSINDNFLSSAPSVAVPLQHLLQLLLHSFLFHQMQNQSGTPVTNPINSAPPSAPPMMAQPQPYPLANIIFQPPADGYNAPLLPPLPFSPINTRPPEPQLNAQDQAAIDYIREQEKNGNWLAEHKELDKGDKKDGVREIRFKNGPLEGYIAISYGKDKPVDILNPDGQFLTQYNKQGDKSDQGKVASPIAFDLDGDNMISTTGQTTAYNRLSGTELGQTIKFDLDGNGHAEQTEWLTGNDGFLFDKTQIQNGNIDGNALFGDQNGQFETGYDKLAQKDTNQDGVLRGNELDDLAIWQDKNRDGKLDKGEVIELGDLGIKEIAVNYDLEDNQRGEHLMRSHATTTDGTTMMTEDVWFGQK